MAEEKTTPPTQDAPPPAPPEPASPPAPAAPPPPEFDWSAAIPPDGAPGIYQKYKTWLDLDRGYRELHGAFTKTQQEHKTAAEQLAEANKKLESMPAPGEPRTFTDEDAGAWAGAIGDYFKDGKIAEDKVSDLGQRPLPPEEILDYFEFKKAQRQGFVNKAAEQVPGFDLDAVEAWVQSGQSPYDDNDIRTVLKFARDGDIGWVRSVWDKFQSFMANGGKFNDPRTGKTFGAPGPDLSGRPPAGEGRGFSSEVEYMDALREAKATNDRLKIQAVYDKLAQTPDSVTDTWRM